MDELKKDEHKTDQKQSPGTPNSAPGTDHKMNEENKDAQATK